MNSKENNSIEIEDTQQQSHSQRKPGTVEKEKERAEKIDRLATKILTDEGMKIIAEAYDSVFQGEMQKSKRKTLVTVS